MGKLITTFPIANTPGPNTTILGVNFDVSPNETILVPLGDLHKGIANGDFVDLKSSQYTYNNIFINISSNTYTLESNSDGKILLFNNPYQSTVYLTPQRIGFTTTILRLNSGVFIANNGTVLNSKSNCANIAMLYSSASLICYSNNTYILIGDIS